MRPPVITVLALALVACYKEIGDDEDSVPYPDTGWPPEEGCPGSVSDDESAAGGQLFVGADANLVGPVEVRAIFNGGTAYYSNVLRLSAPDTVEIGQLHATAPGTEVLLGSFDPGEELVLTLRVPETGDTWTSGPAERNPDGLAHARIVQAGDGTWYGGFEDLYGVGDSDYNDTCFSLLGDLRIELPDG